MNSLNLLLVSYSFPPFGGTGVMRVSSLARYLPAEGIRVDVLTARNAAAVGYDVNLLKQIPSEVTIHRTITLDLPFSIKKGIKRWIGGEKPPAVPLPVAEQNRKANPIKRILENILVPDPQVTWLPVLRRAACRIIRKRRIDIVLITVPPFSSVLLAEHLRKRFPQLPVILDFRDEWLTTTFSLVSFLFSRTERARRVAENSEAKAIGNATAVVAVTEAARRQIRARYSQEPESKFQLVPNGFDATNLHTGPGRETVQHSGRIVVTYVGTVYASTEPGNLVEALRSLPLEVRDCFTLRFIGHIEGAHFRELLLSLGDMVELKGFLPQREALALMNETDYVLLINHDPLNVGGKFYDYVGARKPILGIVHPDGESRRLLDELRAGCWAGNKDLAGIRQLFLDAANRGKAPFSDFQPDLEKIARYERKVLAHDYAKLLSSIVEGSQVHNEKMEEVGAAGVRG